MENYTGPMASLLYPIISGNTICPLENGMDLPI